MLIVGLLVGALVGLLVADFVTRYRSAGWLNWVATWGVLILFLIFVAFAGFFSDEVRVGLVFGTLLGVLVGLTPLGTRPADRPQ